MTFDDSSQYVEQPRCFKKNTNKEDVGIVELVVVSDTDDTCRKYIGNNRRGMQPEINRSVTQNAESPEYYYRKYDNDDSFEEISFEEFVELNMLLDI